MVSDAVGAKVLGERSEGTLPSVSPIGCMESKAKIRFTGSPPDSDVVGVARLQLRSTTRPTSGYTANGCQILQHSVATAMRQPIRGCPKPERKSHLRNGIKLGNLTNADFIENAS